MRPSSVDLPAPFTPTRATRLPRLSLAVMPLMTRPLPPSYSKCTSLTSMTGLELFRMPSSFPGMGKTSFTGPAFGSSSTASAAVAAAPAFSATASSPAPAAASSGASPSGEAAAGCFSARLPASSASASSSLMAFACLKASKLPLKATSFFSRYWMMSVQTALRNWGSWEMTISAPVFRESRYWQSHATACTSRWLVGSSRSRMSACFIMATARIKRMRQPPERSATGFSCISFGKPTCSKASSAETLATFWFLRSRFTKAMAVISRTFMLPRSASETCTQRMSLGMPATRPACSSRMSVVLPQPLCPTTP
mmetsp:Transcript_45583/g.140878  ORF Transcript_45583/g.140878 Transcript_45583/m.140878 type:complete len:311 (+) Transcript_45583:944-1876(+)